MTRLISKYFFYFQYNYPGALKKTDTLTKLVATSASSSTTKCARHWFVVTAASVTSPSAKPDRILTHETWLPDPNKCATVISVKTVTSKLSWLQQPIKPLPCYWTLDNEVNLQQCKHKCQTQFVHCTCRLVLNLQLRVFEFWIIQVKGELSAWYKRTNNVKYNPSWESVHFEMPYYQNGSIDNYCTDVCTNTCPRLFMWWKTEYSIIQFRDSPRFN